MFRKATAVSNQVSIILRAYLVS